MEDYLIIMFMFLGYYLISLLYSNTFNKKTTILRHILNALVGLVICLLLTLN